LERKSRFPIAFYVFAVVREVSYGVP